MRMLADRELRSRSTALVSLLPAERGNETLAVSGLGDILSRLVSLHYASIFHK